MSQKTLDRQSAKFIVRVIENLPELSGTEMEFLTEHPRLLQEKLHDALVPLSRQQQSNSQKFEPKVWKTIKLGVYKDGTAYIKALRKIGVTVSIDACHLINSREFIITGKQETLDLVLVDQQELGFDDDTSYENTCARGEELKLSLCPYEAILALLENYQSLPKGFVEIAMKPFPHKDEGLPKRFHIYSNSDCDLKPRLSMYSYGYDENARISARNKFIFCIKK